MARGGVRSFDVMTTLTVTAMRLALEPVTPDPFIEHLEKTGVGHDVAAPVRPDDATGRALRAG
jgi:hypothetical protein